jgi:hypothetical protein
MIKSVYNFNLSTNENYDNISTKIGITMLELMVLRREVRRGFKIS